MDLKTRGVAPTAEERAAIDSVLGPAPSDSTHEARGGHASRERRHLLLPTLHAVNDHVGWISQEAIDHLAERLDVSPAAIFGVVTFYGLFSTTPRAARQVHVCVDLACRAHADFAPPVGPMSHDAPCLGRCEQAPAALVVDAGPASTRVAVGHLDRERLAELVAGAPVGSTAPEHDAPQAIPQVGDADLVLLRRAGRGDPLDLDAYLADGGFEALRRARELGPSGVIEAVDRAGLLGRGGAGFPTARKWEAVRSQTATPHHLVCNADESEPGTFKDRVLIENDPYALIEAMCIAAFATGCDHGWIYVRGEYPGVESLLRRTCDATRARGLLGPGTGFDVTIVRGAGAYICGEETAIFNSIEGYRGEPRNKPPYPFEVGLFGNPTVVNNVETLLNVPPIVLGATSANRRVFCLSGAVAVPGVYEVELGLTLGELIALAGGVPDGSCVQAVLLGGAAGRFVGPDAMDLVLDHESVAAAGLSLGSGVVMVHDERVDLVDQVRRIAAFFRDESCGQCVPCRVGTVRQQEVIDRLIGGADEFDLLADIGRALVDASICGLGQTAHHAVESAVALDVFRSREGHR
jgi:NADH-quinone oxidoreductase subunit F